MFQAEVTAFMMYRQIQQKIDFLHQRDSILTALFYNSWKLVICSNKIIFIKNASQNNFAASLMCQYSQLNVDFLHQRLTSNKRFLNPKAFFFSISLWL